MILTGISLLLVHRFPTYIISNYEVQINAFCALCSIINQCAVIFTPNKVIPPHYLSILHYTSVALPIFLNPRPNSPLQPSYTAS